MSVDPLDLEPYEFELPPERITQHAAEPRDAARLLVLPREPDAEASHQRVRDLPAWLRAGDLLVVNATRVLPARLRGRKTTGGAVEALLLGPLAADGVDTGRYRALLRATGKLRPGAKLRFRKADSEGNSGAQGELDAELVARREGGEVELAFAPGRSPYEAGEAPLPPYIRRRAPEAGDLERYQCVYAREPGSVAAPTAGLHLTEALLECLETQGVERAEVVLHVGPGTFRPLDARALESRRLHAEPYTLSEACAQAIARTRQRGGRVVAVGTTTARVLETCAQSAGGVAAGDGESRLFLYPGGRPFRVVDALLTNFHLPRSSLLLLVAAFAGRERVLDAYREALAREYRFYSYGDAMLIL